MNAILTRRFFDQIAVMFGREAEKAARRFRSHAQKIHVIKRATNKERLQAAIIAHENAAKVNTWRNRRWAVLIAANLLFTVSFWLDIQILEGALTASRFIGFHLIDLNSALQVMLAHKHIIVNLVIGTGTVLVLWLLLGGRTFCSWVCPYHLLAEWAEKIHLFLVEEKAGDRPEHRPPPAHRVLDRVCRAGRSSPAIPCSKPFLRPASCRAR